MDKSWIFRTKKGNLGLVRRLDNIVMYFLKSKEDLLDQSAQWEWSEWIRYVRCGYAKGDVNDVSKESVEYYFSQNGIYDEKIIEIFELKFPGFYYPRIANERFNFNYISESFFQDLRAYKNIQNSLNDLFNYIEPSVVNLATYGHKIRELLILACTEVEYLLLKVLEENAYETKRAYNTSDYVKCKNVLRLDEFEVVLTQYRSLKVFKPFSGWDISNPTKSIPWYDAYNSVKHNRGDNIKDANIEHLLDAISALHILLQSQYGLNIFDGFGSYRDEKSIFTTIKTPEWHLERITAPLLEQVYEEILTWYGCRKFFKDFPKFLK